MNRFEFLYNFAYYQLQEQNDRLKFMRTVAMSFMTLDLALLGVTWLILADLKLDISLGGVFSILFAIAIAVSFVLSICNSLRTLYLTDWHVGAHPQELRVHAMDTEIDNEQILQWATETLTDAYNKNDKILNEKTSALRDVIFYFWGAVVFVVALGVIAII